MKQCYCQLVHWLFCRMTPTLETLNCCFYSHVNVSCTKSYKDCLQVKLSLNHCLKVWECFWTVTDQSVNGTKQVVFSHTVRPVTQSELRDPISPLCGLPEAVKLLNNTTQNSLCSEAMSFNIKWVLELILFRYSARKLWFGQGNKERIRQRKWGGRQPRAEKNLP